MDIEQRIEKLELAHLNADNQADVALIEVKLKRLYEQRDRTSA